ncbi:MAG: PA14 domain-containing protein [Anaerolineae bacterium]|nr:PA14 domain-containing protein [Anaerolineae bacterium]
MNQRANDNQSLTPRRIVALCMSVVLGFLAFGFAAPAQAASPERAKVGSYTCLWYTVRRGDTLGELAMRYNTTVLTLRRVNGLRTTRIYVGQRLCIPRYQPSPPVPPPSPAGPWSGEYWNNTIQSGPPALARNEAAINFNWGFGSPDLMRVQPDYFSARWTRRMNFAAGVWRFSADVDDGIRIWVDGQVVLDALNFVGRQTPSVDIPLTQGVHEIRVDYVEQTQQAFIRLDMTRVGTLPPAPPPQPPSAGFNNGPWTAEFFANANLAGPATSTSVVCCLRFDWNGAPPVSGVPGGFFSARFSQVRYFPAGVYQFVARVDDGIRIYLDGNLIMNEFREQSARTFTANVNLGAGNHSIVVEYVQYGGTSNVSLYWDFLGDPGGPRAAALGPLPYFPPLP